jgi:hypothetical protein
LSGTWGALQFALGKEFAKHPLVRAKNQAIECLLSVNVVGRAAHRTKFVDVRRLPIAP